MQAGKNGLGLVVRALCALSLALAVLAHQPVLPGASGLPNAATHDLTAYALPDGTLPPLCLAIDDAMLPAPDFTLVECLHENVAVLHVRAFETRQIQAFPPTAPPRGPPAFAA